MGVRTRPSRAHRTHPGILACGLFLVLSALYLARGLLYDAYTLAALPLIWSRHADRFYISAERDGFDLTFANYSVHQTSAAPLPDRVPPVLHHISLGSGAATHSKWSEVRQSCLDMHPDWDAFLWTDETADALVAADFPELYEMWTTYRYPIQRIDALRYMVLYKYGGVVLDMDLQCKRGFGPLRRFEFVAPAAHPTGFSIGFMMASKGNEYIGKLVQNLRRYNRNWLGLPYPTVMFSTGCHYASTIHAFQRNRTELKILAGPPGNRRMHSLNGPVSTPIFNHLGSSSWHSYDAAMIVSLGKSHGWKAPLGLIVGVALAFYIVRRTKKRRI
ncbi:glycosyltransferase family 32 protein [Thermothielavioides terrestris NRRL 8126]|uniref:Glycosyltransferase family 32 protein n=1 Tax=Thermothielavioides terrestris (strain ATCC 38088 / NRRL 8126) TaxID=578455 RepID=G2R9Q0_THETT|nr:glycosyltransferase family 32 protein [Thermothielavioides terrestris NRRL 8126]AEO68738.1 glycosyltransferase family 32 protein [Thermothielavioides terrestris NRRL 8126]